MSKQKALYQEIKKSTRQKQRGIFRRFIRWFVWIFAFGMISGVSAIIGVYFYLSEDLPKISSLKDYRPPVITTVYSDDSRKIAEFYKERRIVVPLSKLPAMLINAFIAAEDARFYQHKGVDLRSIIRAFFKNIEAGAIVQGGSTITQQVTKSFFLTPTRSYRRKIREIILAYRIDKAFAKDEILFLYLNQIYLGHGAYGVEAAAENYFGKSAEALNLAECAMLAGLPQAPSRFSPFRHPERAKERQIYVLKRMITERYIANTEATEAIHTELDIKPRRNWYIEKVPIYTEHIRRYIEEKYGPNVLYKEGLKIYTAVNIEMQKVARSEVEKGLRALDKRQGYRGSIQHLESEEIEAFSKEHQAEQSILEKGKIIKGIVVEVNDIDNTVTVRMGDYQGIIQIADMIWARKPDPEIDYSESKIKHPGDALIAGDVILVKIKDKIEDTDLWQLALEQTPAAQAALLCIEAETGYVKVMVGGRDFRESQFNRAVQSRRQPGSAFKPIIYAAALDKGYTPATVIIDSPIVFKDVERDFKWKPRNYKEKFFGSTLFRKALEKSRNVITIKILQDIGIDYTIEYVGKLGITSKISEDLSIALGSSGVSLLELVNAYSVFANYGQLVKPIFITKIVDRDGNLIDVVMHEKKRVIEEKTAYIMTNLLEGVVKHGTGWRAKALKRPVAGKTGTTNNLYDAWFMGYTPQYITGVWVGFDDEGELGKNETGSRAASPIWLGFMKKVLKDKPVRVFRVPKGIVFHKIDAETGLLAIPESEKIIFECFKEGTAPTEYTKKPDVLTETEEFYKLDM